MPGGRPAAKYSQALRLIKIYEMLQHRDHITIPELMREFEINRRTVQRDVATLNEVYALEEGDRTPDNEKTFRLQTGMRTEILKLTLTEMLALYMGRNMFAFTKGTELRAAMDSLYDKLQARLTARNAGVRDKLPKKLFCTAGFPKLYRAHAETLNDLLTGLIDERKVAITYSIPGRKPYNDVIHPYTLVVHNCALYVIAFSEHARDKRMYAVERIKKAKWSRDLGFDYPAKYDPANELDPAFGISAGYDTTPVRLLFSAQVAPYVASRQWHKSMKTKIRRDGQLEVSMQVSPGEELVHWLTGYGGAAKVSSPKWLRDEVTKRHKEGLS
jgi:predicted DNA-binding transcriptional regulator YafY